MKRTMFEVTLRHRRTDEVSTKRIFALDEQDARTRAEKRSRMNAGNTAAERQYGSHDVLSALLVTPVERVSA